MIKQKKIYTTQNAKEREAALARTVRMRQRLQSFETCYLFSVAEFQEWLTAWQAVCKLEKILRVKL